MGDNSVYKPNFLRYASGSAFHLSYFFRRQLPHGRNPAARAVFSSAKKTLYQAAPSFAYIIGDYTLDRHGVLTGPHNADLIRSLAEDEYQTK